MTDTAVMTGSIVLLLEADPRFSASVSQALKELDPKLTLVILEKMDELDLILQKKSELVSPEAEIQLLLLNADPAAKPEILKTRNQLEQLPTILVSSFEHSEKIVREWSTAGVFNLIQKPYDELLLKQHLKLALHPTEAPKDFTTHNMKTSAVIEMLKEIPMEMISEVGIVTRSDREVPAGRVTKFYGKAFLWSQRMSIYARSLETRPRPEDPANRSVLMTWFGATKEQLLQIRSRFPKTILPFDWRTPMPLSPSAFLILGDPSSAGSELSGTLTRQFKNLEVLSFVDVPGAKVSLPGNLKAVFVHRNLFEIVEKDPRLKDLPKVILSTTAPTEDELRNFAPRAVDLVTLPTERVSFFKRMVLLFPELETEEAFQLQTFSWKETLDVGQPIEITEMNETGLTMKYERPLPVGTIRRFVLWLPRELGLPVLTARCYLSQTNASGENLNYFIFFGMSDPEIKHVRVWMRDHFIQDKAKGQS